MAYLLEKYKVGIHRACRLTQLARSMWYYVAKRDDGEVIKKLEELADRYPTEGFPSYLRRLRYEGIGWNKQRVHRVYKEMKLNIRRKRKRRLPARVKKPLVVPDKPNQVWSMDFMSDSLTSGRKFRILTLLDDYNREALVIEIDMALPSERVKRVLDRMIDYRGKPKRIRVDNGPEFTSLNLLNWCEENRVELQFIQPGKPTQNAYIERFNGSYRRAVLNAHLFEDLDQVRTITEIWMKDYNHHKPHGALNDLPPVVYAKRNQPYKNLNRKNYFRPV